MMQSELKRKHKQTHIWTTSHVCQHKFKHQHDTSYLGMLRCARLSCSSLCSSLCWTQNIPCSRLDYLLLFRERAHVPPQEEEDRTWEIGKNQAYPCNIFSLVNRPGNDDVIFIIFNPFFSAILQLQHWLLWPRIRSPYIHLPHRHPSTGANPVARNE